MLEQIIDCYFVIFALYYIEIVKIDIKYKKIPNYIILDMIFIALPKFFTFFLTPDFGILHIFVILTIIFVLSFFYRLGLLGAGDFKLVIVVFIFFNPFNDFGFLRINDGLGFFLFFIIIQFCSMLLRIILNLIKTQMDSNCYIYLDEHNAKKTLRLYSTCILRRISSSSQNDFYIIKMGDSHNLKSLPLTFSKNLRLMGWFYGYYPLSPSIGLSLLLTFIF